MAIENLPIKELVRDPKLQTRFGGSNPDKVQEYREAYEDGDEFPPIDGFRTPDGQVIVADGFTRSAAKLLAHGEDATIAVNVREGTHRDAMFFALTSANAKHGQPLTLKEKRRRAEEILKDPEWSQKFNISDLSRISGLSRKTVRDISRELAGKFTTPFTPNPPPERVHWSAGFYGREFMRQASTRYHITDYFENGPHPDAWIGLLQEGAEKLSDLSPVYDEAARALVEAARKLHLERFPVASFVKHPNGRVAVVKAVTATSLEVFDERQQRHDSWQIGKHLQPATESEHAAYLNTSAQPPVKPTIDNPYASGYDSGWLKKISPAGILTAVEQTPDWEKRNWFTRFLAIHAVFTPNTKDDPLLFVETGGNLLTISPYAESVAGAIPNECEMASTDYGLVVLLRRQLANADMPKGGTYIPALDAMRKIGYVGVTYYTEIASELSAFVDRWFNGKNEPVPADDSDDDEYEQLPAPPTDVPFWAAEGMPIVCLGSGSASLEVVAEYLPQMLNGIPGVKIRELMSVALKLTEMPLGWQVQVKDREPIGIISGVKPGAVRVRVPSNGNVVTHWYKVADVRIVGMARYAKIAGGIHLVRDEYEAELEYPLPLPLDESAPTDAMKTFELGQRVKTRAGRVAIVERDRGDRIVLVRYEDSTSVFKQYRENLIAVDDEPQRESPDADAADLTENPFALHIQQFFELTFAEKEVRKLAPHLARVLAHLEGSWTEPAQVHDDALTLVKAFGELIGEIEITQVG